MLCLHLLPIFAKPQERFPFGGQISGIQNGGQKTTVLFKCHPFRDFICDSVCDLLYLTGFFTAHSCTKHQTKYTGKACEKKNCTFRIESLRCCRARFNKAQWSQEIFPKETHPKNNTSCDVEAKLNLVPSWCSQLQSFGISTLKGRHQQVRAPQSGPNPTNSSLGMKVEPFSHGKRITLFMPVV